MILRAIAFTLGAVSLGGALPLLWHRLYWPLSPALVLLALSAMAENVEKWDTPHPPGVATVLDIAGYSLLLIWYWTVRERYKEVLYFDRSPHS